MTRRQRVHRPTMVDVARAAGVAVSTVSRVVNADATVGIELVQRVQQAITDLGWEADDSARQLRLGVSGTIGAVVVELDSPFLQAAERAARAAGLVVLTMSTQNDEHLEAEAVRSLCRRRVDGLLIEQGTETANSYLEEQITRGLPVVAMDRPLPGLNSDSVISDNRRGIELAYTHLADRGHRHILYLGDDEKLFTGHARAATFRRCAEQHGHHVHRRALTGAVSAERVSTDLDRALAIRPRPTALITGNAGLTMRAFQHLGAELAGLAFVGFDDLELATILNPPLTVIAQDYPAMGSAAVDMIATRLRQPDLPVRQIVTPVTLIDRNPPSRRPLDSSSLHDDTPPAVRRSRIDA